jgi:hypothetical protein
MNDEKSAAWCHRVRDEVVWLAMEAMIGENVHVVGPSVEHFQRHFTLGQKMAPLINGEIGMSAHLNR